MLQVDDGTQTVQSKSYRVDRTLCMTIGSGRAAMRAIDHLWYNVSLPRSGQTTIYIHDHWDQRTPS